MRYFYFDSTTADRSVSQLAASTTSKHAAADLGLGLMRKCTLVRLIVGVYVFDGFGPGQR